MYKLGKTRETGNDDGYPKTSPSVDLSHFRPFTSFRIKRLFAGADALTSRVVEIPSLDTDTVEMPHCQRPISQFCLI